MKADNAKDFKAYDTCCNFSAAERKPKIFTWKLLPLLLPAGDGNDEEQTPTAYCTQPGGHQGGTAHIAPPSPARKSSMLYARKVNIKHAVMQDSQKS